MGDYVIVDKRDNSYFCGLNGWSKLVENAVWYDKKEAQELCATLNLKFEGELCVEELLAI